MALDPQVALAVRPPQFDNQLANYGQMMQIQNAGNQNRLAEIQYRQALQEESDKNTLRQSLAGVDISTPEGMASARNALIRMGNIKGAQELDKNALATKETQGKISKQDADLAYQKLTIFGGALAPLAQNPTRPAILSTLQALEAQGIKAPPIPLPADDAMLPGWVRQVGAMTDKGLKAMEAFSPKVTTPDTGGALPFVNTNALAGPLGPIAGTTALPKSATPGDVMANQRGLESNAISRGNLGVAQSRLAFDQANPTRTYDAERGVLVNTRTGEAAPATTGGVPLQPREKLTEVQAKAQLYGTRAAESDKILNGLEEKVSVTGLAMKRGAQNVPVIGGPIGAVGNVMLSENQQKVEQAQRNFVNAVLRQESGAVISDAEFANAQEQYFPQPGDSKAVIQQKRENRQSAIEGFTVMSGPAGKRIEAARDKSGGKAGWSIQRIE